MKVIKIKNTLLILILINLTIGFNKNYLAQGRLLRGEVYQEYSIENKEADFYVSVIGNDNWSGKLAEPNKNKTNGPFATIERAKIAVQKLKKEIYKPKLPPIETRFIGSNHKYGVGKDILVLIRNGVYTLDSIIIFSTIDGGERVETDLPTGAFEYHKLKDYYVTYAAYPGENPIISGGTKLINWNNDKGNVWNTSLKEENITELFVNGKRQTLARLPNTGYFETDGIPIDPNYFKFRSDDLKNWKNLESNDLTMIVRWSSIYTKIKSVDEKNKIAYLTEPQKEMLIIPPKYFIENVETLLDTTGEWYFNKSESILSIIPEREITNPNYANIILPKLNGMIKIFGDRENPVRNLRFMNITFQATASGGNAAIDISYAKNCEIISNKIQNVSQSAIKLGLGCYNNLITKNKIIDVNGSGIELRGVPNPENWNDVIYDNIISFNEIEGCSSAHIGIGASNTLRTKISNNFISNVGSYGIAIGSWPNVEESSDGNYLVEFNHVEHANMIRDDEGGIAVFGLSPGSIVKNNLVHDVRPAPTNENVGFFFQNMASGWEVRENIYYNLKQAEMKLCAAYITDNVYENNFTIETPLKNAERIINGEPKFITKNLNIEFNGEITTGEKIKIFAEITNTGSTGIDEVILYVDGKIAEKKKFPVISNNTRKVEFYYYFFDYGKHSISINETNEKTVNVLGQTLNFIYSNLHTSMTEIPLDEPVKIRVNIQNVRNIEQTSEFHLFVDNKIVETQKLTCKENQLLEIVFKYILPKGKHEIKVGNHPPLDVNVYEGSKINIADNNMLTFCSVTAQPCNFNFDLEKNHFEIEASGTDFLHAEDSYGTIFLSEKINGNFIATVKVIGFSEGVSEWFRAGIFVRNDLTKSNVSEEGSKGSFLLFSTPKRNGAQWDEYGDGSMHNTKSFNYGVQNPFPVWLKLIRHGNKFSSYFSFDCNKWNLVRESPIIKGISDSVNIGIAGGTNDQSPSKVIFEDFKIFCESK